MGLEKGVYNDGFKVVPTVRGDEGRVWSRASTVSPKARFQLGQAMSFQLPSPLGVRVCGTFGERWSSSTEDANTARSMIGAHAVLYVVGLVMFCFYTLEKLHAVCRDCGLGEDACLP